MIVNKKEYIFLWLFLILIFLLFFTFKMCTISLDNRSYLKEIRSIKSENVTSIEFFEVGSESVPSKLNLSNYKKIKIIENKAQISTIIHSLLLIEKLDKSRIGSENKYLILLNLESKKYLFYYSSRNVKLNEASLCYFEEITSNEFRKITELRMINNYIKPIFKKLKLKKWK